MKILRKPINAAEAATANGLLRPENGPAPITNMDLHLPLGSEPTAHLRCVGDRVMQLWLEPADDYGDRKAWWVDLKAGYRP